MVCTASPRLIGRATAEAGGVSEERRERSDAKETSSKLHNKMLSKLNKAANLVASSVVSAVREVVSSKNEQRNASRRNWSEDCINRLYRA